MRKTIFYSLLLLSIGLLTATSITRGAKADAPQAPVNLTATVDGMNVSLAWEAPNFLEVVPLNETFPTMEIPATWLNVDQDGDGKSWEIRTTWNGTDGTYFVGSWSWVAGQSTFPDNWLISPKVKVPASGKLHYNVGPLNPTWPKETYAVMLSETNTDIASFTKQLLKESLNDPIRSNGAKGDKASAKATPSFFDRTIDLSEYAGKEVYIAFRHFEGVNEFCIALDNVAIKGMSESTEVPAHSYNVYRDGQFVKNTSSLNFAETVEEYGTYVYEVETKLESGEVSPRVSKTVTVADRNAKAYIILESHDLWGDGTGYQIFLDNTASAYGNAIPSQGSLVVGCNVPVNLDANFSHRVPANADISCSPENWIVDGVSETIAIPAGVYDFCVTNPQPGVNIWIAAGDNGRKDDFEFKAGVVYRFSTAMNGQNDSIIIEEETPNPTMPATNVAAAVDGNKVTLTWDAPASKREALLEEDFEAGLPSTWSTIDADGDGNTWQQVDVLVGHGGAGKCITSHSYMNYVGELHPDNYLVTPQLNLSGAATLTYWVCAQDADWAAETYAVYASTTGNAAADFTTELFKETLTAKDGAIRTAGERGRDQGAYYERSVTIPAGTKYVAFRHFESSDMFAMNIDDVKIVAGATDPDPTNVTYTIKRGETVLATGHTATTYVEENAPNGTHEYCVTAVHPAGASNPTCTSVIVGQSDFAPVTNLQGNFANGKVNLTWKAPVATKGVVLEEGFEGEGMPTGWTTIDKDGDGFVWTTTPAPWNYSLDGHNGGKCISSHSFVNQYGPVTPDNFLVTPALNLPDGGTMTFWVCAQDDSWPAEPFAVYASKAGNTAEDFLATTALLDEVLTAKNRTTEEAKSARDGNNMRQGNWHEKTVTLPAGTKYVAIRHYNVTDQFMINLDDVKITTEGGGGTDPVNDWTYNVYREGALLNNVATESYEDAYSTPGTYKYEVEVKYPGGVSPKVAVNVTIPSGGGDGSSLVVLEAHDVWGDATGYILLMDKTASMFGVEIPATGALVIGCDVPADLQGKFSHIIPTTGVIDCAPAADQWVVDGTAELVIEPGIYDYCIINPQPGVNIWIAAGDNARKDNFEVLAGKKYHFTAELAGFGDNILLEVSDWTGVEETLASSNKVYGIEGYIVIEAETGKANVYDIQGRRIATQQVNGKAMVPAQAGIYVVQLGKTASKVVVK